MSTNEEGFEIHIADWLVAHGGYRELKVGGGDFDAALGMDLVELFAFLVETQPDAWAARAKLSHGDDAATRKAVADRIAKEIDKRGTVDVIRHGVQDFGINFKLAYFKPAHELTPELRARYDANRLTVRRQLPFAAGQTKTLDLALFINGIPVATAELKNRMTGQTVEHAKGQYRTDRDPKNITLSQRAVVHFAVDSEVAAMTTRLAGTATRFLHFNRGHNLGAGNPPIEGKHRTAYLWEEVWQRDNWLDLFARFIHVEKPARGSRAKPTVIFPRYHQWDAVLRMEAHARANGPGQRYLVQHSAGSGKSNTIAWLAHRLSNLHADNAKVFDKVIVITDRVVLDRQLQDTIYQFEHAEGVVVRIDENSQQLADALAGAQARIIITTLQKFPFVLDKVESLPERTYAVLIDEAHSSQTGETAKEMKKVLGAGAGSAASAEAPTSIAAEGEGDYDVVAPDEVAELLAANVEARGEQHNLSFFAFTATPKGKTLELFGQIDPATGKHAPFHLYSMKQAIDEGYIHDVLANYITYETYFNLQKKVEDDPEYDKAKAQRAIARFMSLHEGTLVQKATIVIEHFRQHVAGKIGGKAKAMVVCSSVEHAIRFHAALKKVNDEHGNNLGILVAFSGTRTVDGKDVSESKLNGFPESQTAAEFDTDDYRILVVAEKFQTGFDQPKLYAMYVDKTLTGLAAVQTLSRLNRTMAGKDGTFVLDFRNDADAIRDAFSPYFTQTVAPPSDPNLLWDTRAALDEFQVLREDEAKAVAAQIAAPSTPQTHERVHALITPAVDRFAALGDEEQDAFRDALQRFVRTYSFLSQLVRMATVELERDYLYCKALLALIKDTSSGEGLDLGSEVELTHLRTEQTFSGSLALDPETGEVQTIHSGTGKQHEPVVAPLSGIIDKMNEMFGTKWTEQDKLHFDEVFEEVVADSGAQRAAVANSQEEWLKHVLPSQFLEKLVHRREMADELTYSTLDNAELQAFLMAKYGEGAYVKSRVAGQQAGPIGDLLGPPPKEGLYLEYKATFRVHAAGEDVGQVFKPLETASLKTIAAFLNSRPGGTLLIGVNDDGEVTGLEPDYASLRKDGKDDADLFQLHLTQAIINCVGEAAAANVSAEILTVGGKDLCRVNVTPSKFPVDATVTLAKKGQLIKAKKFYGRFNNGTRAIEDDAEADKYKIQIWG